MTKRIIPEVLPVTFVKITKNEKACRKGGAKCSATYADIESTCPDSCQLKKEKTCYGMYGNTRWTWLRLMQEQPIHSLIAARIEASLIKKAFRKRKQIPQDGARGGRDCRLHVIGDCRNPTAAAILAEAARDWRSRGGGVIWTYTHAWKVIPKVVWDGISILASIDNLRDGVKALKKGYAPACYVGEFPSHKAWDEAGVKWIPCPAQTGDVVCVECRLCLNDDKLAARGCGIAFTAHGVRKSTIRKRLSQEVTLEPLKKAA